MSFDGFASKYDKFNRLHFGKEYDVFRERTVRGCDIGPESVILEFGCGTSLCLEHILNTRDFHGVYVGLDVSAAMLEQGREKFIRPGETSTDGNADTLSPSSTVEGLRTTHVQIGRVGPLPVRDHSIDAIVSSLVFHLLPRDRRMELLAEFRRILKPGGSICLNEFGRPGNFSARIFRFYVLYFWSIFVRDERNSRDLFDGRLISEVKVFFPDAIIRERTRELIDHVVARGVARG